MSSSAPTTLLRRAGRTVLAGGIALTICAASPTARVLPFAPGVPFAAGVPVAQAAPIAAPVAAPIAAPDTSALELQVFHLVNADRAVSGLAPLELDPSLVTIARWRSEDMAVHGYFSHDMGGVAGDYVFRLLNEQLVRYRIAGENLARTYAPLNVSAVQVEAALMESPTHQANILLPSYTHLGVGVAIGPDGRTLYTQLFRQEW